MYIATLDSITTNEVSERENNKPSSDRFGHVWEVINQQTDFRGGELITFKFRDEYKDNQLFAEKENEIFPAVEGSYRSVKMPPILHSLGYSQSTTGSCWTAPDRTALLARFDMHRKLHRSEGLQPLKILSSEGTASDMDFVYAYTSGHDALLSNGKEFVHDHVFHVSHMLEMLLDDPKRYYLEKKRNEEIISKAYERIVRIEKEGLMTPLEIQKLQLILGAFVDILWAASDIDLMIAFRNTLESPPYQFLEKWDQNHFKRLWAKKFEGEVVSIPALSDLWNRSLDKSTR